MAWLGSAWMEVAGEKAYRCDQPFKGLEMAQEAEHLVKPINHNYLKQLTPYNNYLNLQHSFCVCKILLLVLASKS